VKKPRTYGWFTEGFDTRDLKEAKALLEGLASQQRQLAKSEMSMSESSDISRLYREFADALTEVLAENAVGPARPTCKSTGRRQTPPRV
jgi:uncharacterized protein Smg (DUF494 family)